MGQGMALRKFALLGAAGLAALALAGCGNRPDSPTMVRDIVRGYTATPTPPKPMPEVTQAMLARQKTPLIAATIEKTEGQALMPLAGRSAGVDTFVTGDGSTLAFREGVLVATRGLRGADLMSADAPSRATIARGTGQVSREMFFIDGDNQSYGVRFLCDLSNIGQENLVIAERNIATRRVSESCRSDEIAFENTYWIEDSGAIRASRQWISAYLGSVQVRQLKD